jgi:hypothetical protein
MPGSTVVLPETLQIELNRGSANTIGDVAQRIQLGTILTPQKYTTGVSTASATWTITQLIAAYRVTNSLTAPEKPADPTSALVIKTLRVLASGTAASVGAYIVTDAGGTATLPTGGANAGVGIALLSDDGTTITFPNTVTNVAIEFVPAPAVSMTGTTEPLDGL